METKKESMTLQPNFDSGIDLKDAFIEGLSLKNGDLKRANLLDGVNFEEVDLERATSNQQY